MRLVLQPTSTWRLPITARSACAAPSRWRIGCSSFGSTRPSRASRSASRRSLLLVPPWISRTAWACAVITSCPSSSSNRCTHGEWLPTSITTRQRAIPSNRLRIARAVVAIRPSSLTSPCSSTTQSWLYRSPRSTPIVSRGPTLVSSFMVGLRSWASEPVDVSWGSYVDTPQTEVDLLIPSRTLRHSSDSSDTGKGNELTKSFVRCLSPVALKSLGPLALLGSTPSPGTFSFLRLTGEVQEGDANSLMSTVSIWVSSFERPPGHGLIDIVGLSKWAPRLQPRGGRSGVPSIGCSIERQVDALVRYDAMRVDEARLDVLRLEPGIALQDCLRPISCGEHSKDMFDGKSVAPNSRLPAQDPGVHSDPLKEFIGCRNLPLHSVLSPLRPPTVRLDPLCAWRKKGWAEAVRGSEGPDDSCRGDRRRRFPRLLSSRFVRRARQHQAPSSRMAT